MTSSITKNQSGKRKRKKKKKKKKKEENIPLLAAKEIHKNLFV